MLTRCFCSATAWRPSATSFLPAAWSLLNEGGRAHSPSRSSRSTDLESPQTPHPSSTRAQNPSRPHQRRGSRSQAKGQFSGCRLPWTSQYRAPEASDWEGSWDPWNLGVDPRRARLTARMRWLPSPDGFTLWKSWRRRCFWVMIYLARSRSVYKKAGRLYWELQGYQSSAQCYEYRSASLERPYSATPT